MTGPPILDQSEVDPTPPEAPAPQVIAGTPDPDSQKKSAATALVEIAEELFSFGVSDAGETFAVPRTGPRVVALLRGGKVSLRSLLARRFFATHGRAASQQALADALLVVEGIAQESEPQALPLRVASHRGDAWLDLGDDTGRAVQITHRGWEVMDEAPVLFKRTVATSPLPVPASGGSIDRLWRWLNVAIEDRPLVLAWLVAVLDADTPHPILGLFGEQGTGKTTAEKVLVSVLDPGPAPTRTPPRDSESWVTQAGGSWVVGVDNVSGVSDWFSDALCRAVTGDAEIRRKLYSDGDLFVTAFRRCVAITGIDVGSVRGDLADRLLPIDLDRIDDRDRLEEREMWTAWGEDHPLILGGLLDLAAQAGQAGDESAFHLGSKPRMADYARTLAEVDHVLGSSGLDRYLGKQGTLAADSLTADAFIVALADTLAGTFEGTSAELLDVVRAPDRLPKGWPVNARQVTQTLRRQAPPMRKAGWAVDDDGGANKAGVLRWTVARPEIACIGPLPDPPDLPTGAEAGQAGQEGHEYGPSLGDGGSCDLCGAVALRQAGDGAWRHSACEDGAT